MLPTTTTDPPSTPPPHPLLDAESIVPKQGAALAEEASRVTRTARQRSSSSSTTAVKSQKMDTIPEVDQPALREDVQLPAHVRQAPTFVQPPADLPKVMQTHMARGPLKQHYAGQQVELQHGMLPHHHQQQQGSSVAHMQPPAAESSVQHTSSAQNGVEHAPGSATGSLANSAVQQAAAVDQASTRDSFTQQAPAVCQASPSERQTQQAAAVDQASTSNSFTQQAPAVDKASTSRNSTQQAPVVDPDDKDLSPGHLQNRRIYWQQKALLESKGNLKKLEDSRVGSEHDCGSMTVEVSLIDILQTCKQAWSA